MRTRTAAERATIKAPNVEHHLWVEIQNKDRTYIDLSDWVQTAEWSDSIDQPTGTFTLTFRRDSEAQSLAPTMGGSTLNRDNAAAYAPLLYTGRNVKIYTAVVDPGVDPTTKKKLAFWGRIDRVRWNTEPVEVTGRDLGGWIVDAWIQQERAYGGPGGSPIENIMASVLAADPVFGTPTLYVPTSPGYIVTNSGNAKQPVKSVLEALQQDYALAIGWVCRYRFDNADDTPKLTFFDINRTKTVPDDEFGPDEYQDITGLEVDDSQVRNKIVGRFYDSAGVEHTRTVENAASQAAYGVKYMEIDLALGDPINTNAEMDAMLNAASNDLSEPLTTQEMKTLYYWPVQLGDLYNFKANDDHYDSDQKLAVVSYAHRFENGEAWTTMQCRGTVIGAYHAWFRRGTSGSGDGSSSDPNALPEIKQLWAGFPAATATVEIIGRGSVAVGSWRIALSTDHQPTTAEILAAPVYSGQNIDVLITQAVYTGQKLYVGAIAFSDVLGNGTQSAQLDMNVSRDGGGVILPRVFLQETASDDLTATLEQSAYWAPGAPPPYEYRWKESMQLNEGVFSDWYETPLLPQSFVIDRHPKNLKYFVVQVRQGSSDATIASTAYAVAGSFTAINNDGVVDRSVPYSDGGFALKATDTGGFIADPGTQDDRLRPFNTSFQYGVDTMLGVVDGDGYARVPYDGTRFNLGSEEIEAIDFVLSAGTGGTPGSPGSPVAIYDEAVQITPDVTSLKFVGAGVSASAVGSDVTVTIGDFLTQAAGDARYLQQAGGTLAGALTAQMIDIQSGYGLRGPNGAFILARNAANTAYVDLLYMDASDAARIPRSLILGGGLRQVGSYMARIESSFINAPQGTTGPGIEMGIDGGAGLLQGYDRTAGAYIPLRFAGSSFKFYGPLRSENEITSGVPWWQLDTAGASPGIARLIFGTDGTGYAFAIAKNVAGTSTDLFRFYDTGQFTATSVVLSSGLVIGTKAAIYFGWASGTAQPLIDFDSRVANALVVGDRTGSFATRLGGTSVTTDNRLGVYGGLLSMEYAGDGTSPRIQSYSSRPLYINELGNAIRMGGATVLNVDQEALLFLPVTSGAAAYMSFYDSLGSSRRAYIGLGGGSGSGAHLYINSDSGSVYILANGGQPVMNFATAGISSSYPLTAGGTYGWTMGDIGAGGARIRYAAAVTGSYDFINSSNGYAGLLASSLRIGSPSGAFLAYWNNNYIQVTPGGGAGGFLMHDGIAGRGYIYVDSSGFGLLHSGGSWLLKNPYGTLDLVVGNNITAHDFILA